MESRSKTDSTSNASGTNTRSSSAKSAGADTEQDEIKKTGDENGSTNTPRLTRTQLRTSAAAALAARRNSAAAAARRSISKAKTSIAYRTSRTSFSQPVRRSSRVTPSSKKADAEEQAAIDEAVRQKNELEAIKEKLAEPYVMESVTCEFDGLIYRLADIISVKGQDGNKYYAKITAFYTNKFADRFVAIRWFLPKFKMTNPIWKNYKGKGFLLHMYNEGPANEKLMPMEFIKFVNRLPIDPGLFGEPFLLYKNNRLINIMAEKPLSSISSMV